MTHSQSGRRAANFRQQRRQQIHLANADGMEPNARPIRLAPRHLPEKLGGKAFAIFAFTDRLPEEPWRGDDKCDEIDEIQKV